jgi:hypothetical protein
LNEIWKDIPEFESYYQVSNLGNLKSYKGNKNGRILKNNNKYGSYLSVFLCINGKKRSTRMHRIVAETFIPNPDNLPEVNHIDGNRQNNEISNLEWCSHDYNVHHSMSIHPNQIKPMNDYNRFVRPNRIWQCTLSGEKLNLFVNSIEASKITGVCHRNILQVCNKTEFKPGHCRKQAGGYRWEFEFITERGHCA